MLSRTHVRNVVDLSNLLMKADMTYCQVFEFGRLFPKLQLSQEGLSKVCVFLQRYSQACRLSRQQLEAAGRHAERVLLRTTYYQLSM